MINWDAIDIDNDDDFEVDYSKQISRKGQPKAAPAPAQPQKKDLLSMSLLTRNAPAKPPAKATTNAPTKPPTKQASSTNALAAANALLNKTTGGRRLGCHTTNSSF